MIKSLVLPLAGAALEEAGVGPNRVGGVGAEVNVHIRSRGRAQGEPERRGT